MPASVLRTPSAVSSPAVGRRVTGRSLRVAVRATHHRQQEPAGDSFAQKVVGAVAAASLALAAGPCMADVRLPPIDSDPNRCERAFDGNTIGQANAVSDRVLDLRKCNLDSADLSGKTLSGGLLSDASFKGAIMRETVFSKAYAVKSDFSGADMTNAVVDRVDFSGANLSRVNFTNAVITGGFWNDTNLDAAIFEDALIGSQDAKNLCLNPTLTGDSRVDVGCRN